MAPLHVGPELQNIQWFLAGAEAFALKKSEASENGDTNKITWLTLAKS
jgi:hypothetical protein